MVEMVYKLNNDSSAGKRSEWTRTLSLQMSDEPITSEMASFEVSSEISPLS